MRTKRKAWAAFFPLALVVALALAGGAMAEDDEGPVIPPGNVTQPGQIGDYVIVTPGLPNDSIDSREAAEPQLTTQLTTSDEGLSSGGTLTVETQPTFEVTAAP